MGKSPAPSSGSLVRSGSGISSTALSVEEPPSVEAASEAGLTTSLGGLADDEEGSSESWRVDP